METSINKRPGEKPTITIHTESIDYTISYRAALRLSQSLNKDLAIARIMMTKDKERAGR